MTKVTVYRVRFTDASTASDEMSHRWFTRQGARMFDRATLIEDTAADIDESDVEPGEQWTTKYYVLAKHR